MPGDSDAKSTPAQSDPAPEPKIPSHTGTTAGPKEDEPEVDRILLAKEFAGLLQVPKEDDEASR